MSEMPSSDDERLVALLDGEIGAADASALVESLAEDAELRARFARLGEGGEGVRPALALLAEAAPLDRLDAILDGAIAANAPSARNPARRRSWLRLPHWLPSPVLAALVAGIAGVWIGYAALRPAEPNDTWLDAVAGYWSLTTPDTLAIEPSSDQAGRELALAADRLGVPLTVSALTLPEASFRGAMLLDYDGRPLTQIAYLSSDGVPFAYCVIKAPKAGETEPSAAVLGGFNVVHWSGGGYARMLIGRVPPDDLKRYADVLMGRAT